MKVSVTKKFEFAYAHRLPGYDGKCKHLHGHTGILEIEIEGGIIQSGSCRGMVMDFSDLKNLVQQEVIDVLDHSCLNDVLSEQPTAENTALWVWRKLRPLLSLVRVRVYETPSSYAEIKV